MAKVRIRLHTARIHLEFSGDESVFGNTIEPLVLRAAGRTGSRPAIRAAASPAPSPTAPPPPPKGASVPTYSPPSQDFGTFRRQLDPGQGGDAARIAAYAFFLWNYEKKEVFEEDEVAGCFHAEGDPMPEDAAALYEDLVARRILRPADDSAGGTSSNGASACGSGAWRLTSKGRAHVRHHLLSA